MYHYPHWVALPAGLASCPSNAEALLRQGEPLPQPAALRKHQSLPQLLCKNKHMCPTCIFAAKIISYIGLLQTIDIFKLVVKTYY